MFFNNTLRKVSYGLKSRSNRKITILHTIFRAKEISEEILFPPTHAWLHPGQNVQITHFAPSGNF